ncbi:DUF1036 domain-containing protein [Flavobacterium sp. WC2421]|uniref:DUF1036 domain-containing protein n=1 Tax=Flavobacterium sp. WC2421 TaxID=3234138 RepID=UPI003467D19B
MKIKKYQLIIITFLLFTKSFSQVIFKNTGSSKIFVAIGFYEKNTGWTTKGWFPIEPNEEQNLYTPKLFGSEKFYYCATIEKCDKGFFGNTSLYVNKQDAFTIANADNNVNYNNSLILKYKFIETKINTLESNTIKIEPNNLTCYNKKQGKWKMGLDKEGNFAELKEDIRFYREISFTNDIPIGWCKDYYPDGTLKSEYKLLSFLPFKYDGKCSWYKKDGSLEKEIEYKNGTALSETSTINNGEIITKKAQYEVVKLPIQNLYLNSTSNAYWKGGNSKSIIPVELPEGTVEWYYEYTSSRNKELVQSNVQQFSLAKQLTSLIDTSGLLNASINMFSSPPGNDVCDVYLFENEYYNQFLNGTTFNHFPIGTRQNFKSGIVQIRNFPLKNPRIGIKNNDMTFGINVSIQIVAIVSKI